MTGGRHLQSYGERRSEALIRFTSLLWIWRSDKAGRWYFLTLPEEQSAEVRAAAMELPRGFGSVRVEARIGSTSWRTSLFPLNKGGYILPVKAAVRKAAALAVGEEVETELRLL